MPFHTRIMQPGDQPQVVAMTATAFSREHDEADYYHQHWLAHPGAGPDSVRVGVVDDEVVATMAVISRDLRVGPAATVRTACIRDVTTLKVHRGMGYGARLIRETLAGLAAEGYALAYLDGIKDFYGRFGFAPVVPFTALHLKLADLADLREGRGQVRRATPADVPALHHLAHSAWEGRTGSLVRSEAHWRWLLTYHVQPIWVLEGDGGTPIAYAHEYTGNNLVDEWGAAKVGAGLRLLRWLAREEAWEGTTLRLAGPPDYALFRATERRLLYEYEIYGHPDGGWMAAVLDPQAVFTAILPELTRRWAVLPRHNAALRLVLDDGEEIGLRLRRDGVTLDHPPRNAPTAQVPRRHLAPLLFGTRTAEELAAEHGVRCPPAARALLAALFPRAWAWLPGLDWF
jgi:predicted N-acetyltransferase YhbS